MIQNKMELGGRKWTKEEIDFLIDNSTKLFSHEIADKLNRSRNSIIEKICDLGLIGCKKHFVLSMEEEIKRVNKIRITCKLKYLGENHWGWGGGSSEDYYKRICFEYYMKKCIRCGKTNFRNKDLVVHHLDGNNQNNVITNLIPLCKSCHSLVHIHNINLVPVIKNEKLII